MQDSRFSQKTKFKLMSFWFMIPYIVVVGY